MSKRLRLAVELPGEDLLTAISSADHLITNYIKQLNPVYLLLGAERNTPLMGVSPNPGILACWISRRLKNCGLVIAASLQRDHPYNLARRVASFDHISKGRTGILLMAEDHGQSLGLVKRSSWIEEPLSALAVADGMIAMRKLWRTWPRETLHANPEISSAAKVRYAVHQGVFSTSGPLNSPTTLQGEPLLFWYVNPYPWHDDDRHCLSYADAAIVNYADFKQFISWSSSETKNANDRHESVQIHVRLKLQDLKQDVINDLEQHAEVTALILVCDKLSLPDLVERVLTISRLSALTNLHEPFETLRSLLKIPPRTEPDLSANPTAFSPTPAEPA